MFFYIYRKIVAESSDRVFRKVLMPGNRGENSPCPRVVATFCGVTFHQPTELEDQNMLPVGR